MKINNNYILFFILIIIGIYFYNNINASCIPNFIIYIYKNPLFKIIFLLALYLFGRYNIPLALFIAVNYIGLDHLIQQKELMQNI
jgi:hypothetical protein